MIKLTMKFNGLFGRLKKGDAATLVRQNSQKCLTQAVTEYVTGTQDPSLSSRMKPSAMLVYGFKRRSAEYVKQQIRDGGGIRPYSSPRRTNYARLAGVLLKGDKASAMELLRATQALARAYRTPMRKLVTRPGGFRVSVAGSGNVMRCKLTLPGAAILNRGGAKNAIYRQQLLDLSLGAGRDRAFIFARVNQLMQDNTYRFGNEGKVSGLRGLKNAYRKLA